MKKKLLLLILTMLPLVASADAVEIDGIYYNLISENNTAEVTSNPNQYTGSIVIPETVSYDNVTYSVTSIGRNAFYWCYGLPSVTIPNSVTSLGNSAFQRCSGLTSVTIPNSVTSIGESAFYGCSGLTSITIPNSVTSIGSYAFGGADILTIISLIENPFEIVGKTSWYSTFSLNTFDNAKLYVPIGTIDKYKATEGWKDFAFIEEGYPSGINVVENTKSSNTTIYNLNGVRQSELKKGVNILNGKKVIVK